MTSANLSVGLKTQSALDALKAFKTAAIAEMRGFKIEAQVDFQGSVKEAMKAQPQFGVNVYVNGEAVTKKVKGAIESALSDPFEVKINTGVLISQIQGAVKIGLEGASLSVGAVTGARTAGPGVDVKTMMTQVSASIGDAVANQVGKAVQKASADKSGAQGSIGFSAKDPITGMSIGVRERVDAQMALPQTLALIEQKRQEDAAKAGQREEAELRKTRLSRRQQEDAAWAAHRGDSSKDKNAAFDLADRETRKKISQDEADSLKQIIRERIQANRDGLTSAQNFFAAERKVQDEQRAMVEAKQKSDKTANNEFASIRAARLRKESEENVAWASRNAEVSKSRGKDFDTAERDARQKVSADQTQALKDQIKERLNAERAGVTSAQNFFAAERKIQDEILALEKERKLSFGQGRMFATEQRQTASEASRADQARSGAFDTIESNAKKVRDQEMARTWAFQEAQRAAEAKKNADMERLAQVAAISRKQQLDKEVSEFREAESAKEAAQRDSVLRSKGLVAEAQRVANATWQSIKSLRRSEESDATKNVRFANPGQTNEIKRLEGQLKTLAEAEALIGKNGAGLAIRKYGTDAVSAIPEIEALKQKLLELRAVANAAGSGKSGPSPEALLRQQMANVRASAETEARSTGKYTGLGVRAAGAKAVADQFGEKAAGAFINNDALMSASSNLDTHLKKVEGTAAAYKRWKENMNDVHSASRGLAGSLGLLWVTWGNTAPIVAAAAIGAAMRSVFTVGKDLEYQLRFVSVLSNDAAVPMQKFGEVVRGSMVLPTEAAQGLRALAQNGLGVRDAMQALPSILNLATAGEMSLSEAALGATGVMAAFNLQVSDLGRIGDVFAKAAAVSNTSVTAMVEAMKQASTVSDQYKVSLEETAASLAVMAKRNIEGSAAGTAFRNMMVELATPHEKAKKAMAQVGLQLYDNSNQLKSYGEVLTQLRSKTVLMNEQGRLTFLNEMFGERGAKAVNALLSDFDLYKKTLDDVKNKSQDFAASVAAALQETTQGKLKAMVTEFQLATTETFFKANADVNYFIDSLRAAARSQEFQQFLTVTAKAVTELTSFLVEHGATVVKTIGYWMGFRVIEGVISGLFALRGALVASTVAASSLRLAMLGALGAATGGVALVAALAAEFLLLKANTYDSVEEQKKFNVQLDLVADALAREAKTLADSNALLIRRNELMRQGKTAAQADEIVDGEAARRQATDYRAKTEKAKADLVEQKRLIQEYETWKEGLKGKAYGAGDRPPVSLRQYQEAQALIPELQKTVDTAARQERDFADKSINKLVQSAQETSLKRRREIESFNKKLSDVAAESKGKIKTDDLVLSADLIRYNNDDDYTNAVSKARSELNKRLGGFSPTDPHKIAEERADAKSAASILIKEMERERQKLENQISNQRKIDNSIFDEKTLGSETHALMENNRAREEAIKILGMEAQWREALKVALKNPSLKPRDRAQYEDALEGLEAKAAKARADLETSAAVAGNVAIRKARESAMEYVDLLEGLRQKSQAVSDDIRRATEKKYIDPETAVRNNAAAKIDDVYQTEIVRANKEVADTKARITFLQNLAVEGSERERQEASAALSLQQQRLVLKEREAGTLVAERDKERSRAGTDAVDAYKRSLTADAGFERFWGEYRELGANSADFVYNAMKTSTDNMGRAFEQFGATGKMNSRSLINSIMSDLGRLAAQSLWRQLLGFAIGSFGGGGFIGGSVPGNSIGGDISAFAFAKGGVMTPYGALPLQKYSSGGVARSAQVAIHGEGRKPEAYVPLEDGRTIPVTVQGVGGGGNSTTVVFSPTISVDSRSDKAQVQVLIGQQLKEYHEMLTEMLKDRGVPV